MSMREDRRLVRRLVTLPPRERMTLLWQLDGSKRRELTERWAAWALDSQLLPAGEWRVWLIRAGRGFGKTRAGAEWVNARARELGHDGRIALVGASMDEVRRVMIEGRSGLLAVARAGEEPEWRPTTGEVRFPSGAIAHCFSAETPEKLRGPEHHLAWCDELAKWRRGDDTWDNLSLGLRAGDRPQAVVTTTPRATKLVKRLRAMPGTRETVGRTGDNPHLPEAYLHDMVALYGGTRLGRQELDGELIDDFEGALWTRDLVEECRVEECRVETVPALRRVVVGVDPPAGTISGRGGDACGIVCVGEGVDGIGYVLEDASVADALPTQWAAAVAACAARHGADRVIAEANNGGRMVEIVLRAAAANLPLTLTHAAHGKVARAEPVSLLYRRGQVRHVRPFPALEDELCGLVVGGGYQGPGRSPDRADALVWALTELMLEQRATASVRVM